MILGIRNELRREVEWSGVEWSGEGWSGVEWSGRFGLRRGSSKNETR